jgi:hypothetical protein
MVPLHHRYVWRYMVGVFDMEQWSVNLNSMESHRNLWVTAVPNTESVPVPNDALDNHVMHAFAGHTLTRKNPSLRIVAWNDAQHKRYDSV